MYEEAAAARIKSQLHRVLDGMRTDFDRIELLAAALEVFSQPIPDYEPKFRQLTHASLGKHQLPEGSDRKA